jgi:hypothetical protein
MRTVKADRYRDIEIPETWKEAEALITHSLGGYNDRRGGNVARHSVAARVAFAMFGEKYMAADPVSALMFLLQEICRREGAGLQSLEPPRKWRDAKEDTEKEADAP